MTKTCARSHSARTFYTRSANANWKTLCNRNTPYNELLKRAYLFVFMVVQTYPFKSRIFHVLKALNGTPPVTFELKVSEQNQRGFWKISIRPTSGASFIKIGRPTFSTPGTLSQTMTLKLFAYMWSVVRLLSSDFLRKGENWLKALALSSIQFP